MKEPTVEQNSSTIRQASAYVAGASMDSGVEWRS